MIQGKHVYVITLILPDGLNYFTGFERDNRIPGLVLTGWNIYREYAKEFTDKVEARKVCSRIKRDRASSKAMVKPVYKFKPPINGHIVQ